MLKLGLKDLRLLCYTLVRAIAHKRAEEVELTAVYERLLRYAQDYARKLGYVDLGFKIKPIINAKHKVGTARICPDLSCRWHPPPVSFEVLPDADKELNERLLFAQARLYTIAALYRGGFFG